MLAAAGTFIAVAVRERTPDPQELAETAPRLPESDSNLGLRVDSDGDRLSLSWNRRNPLVRSAVGASLVIEDGSQHREVRLDSSQLTNGAVSYKPVSNDVTFRLRVNGKRGSNADSMRVLDGTSFPASKPIAALGAARLTPK